MFEVGQKVRVLPPFADSFPSVCEIVEVHRYADGQAAYELVLVGQGEIGAFSPEYLEAAE